MYIFDMKEIISTSKLGVEPKEDISCTVDMLDEPRELNDVTCNKLLDTDSTIDIGEVSNVENVSVMKCASFSTYKNSYNFSMNDSSSRLEMFSPKTLQVYPLAHHCEYLKKTLPELESQSLKELQILLEDLTRAVETVSSELVQLLLENDSLQQESDARNVAIEQLLKMTVKNTETELRPIQMSVILPADKSEDNDDTINES